LFTDDIFIVPEKMPEFEGGDKAIVKFLKDNIRIPAIAPADNIQGTIYVQFIVERDGQLSHVAIKRPLKSDLDREAIRVVQQFPKWKPGMYKGKPVRVQMALPVHIELK
jgi:protein TonB